jgi:hypothetical protein
MNPSTHIHITGKVAYATSYQLAEFEIAKQKLMDLGFTKVTTAADDLPTGDEMKDPDALSVYLRKRNDNLKNAKAVVHLTNYQDDKSALLDVRLAINDRKLEACSIVRFLEKYGKEATV